jgi:peptidoglycan/LPS O-acetylase OafA/YrhL
MEISQTTGQGFSPRADKILYAQFIDGLRALAVAAVVLFHIDSSWVPGGFVGVDVFFVISGFVVSAAASQYVAGSWLQFVAQFYSRRLARITPALVLVLLASFVGTFLFIPMASLSTANIDTGLSSFLGLSNFTLLQSGRDYFAPSAAYNMFTQTWSLAIEEQFYFCFPLLFVLWGRNKKTFSISIFAILSAISLLIAYFTGQKNPSESFYMLWTRFWELGLGVLLFQMMLRSGHSFTHESPGKRSLAVLAWLSLMALAVSMATASEEHVPFPTCILPVAASLGILGSLHGRPYGWSNALLTAWPLRFLGRISYSLYLWHWPVVVLLRWTYGLEVLTTKVAAGLATLALAWLSYRFVESPALRLRRRAPRNAVIAGGLLLLAAGYLGANTLAGQQIRLSLSAVMRNGTDWYLFDGFLRGPDGREAVTTTTEQTGGSTFTRFSRIGPPVGQPFPSTLYVMGDSHAMHYTLLLKQFVFDHGGEVLLFAQGGCPVFGLFQREALAEDPCSAGRQTFLEYVLTRIQPGDVLFLPSMRLLPLVSQWKTLATCQDILAGMASPMGRAGRQEAMEETVLALRRFTEIGVRVVLEGPPPIFQTVPFRCADWFNRDNPICRRGSTMDREMVEALRRPVLETMTAIAQAVPGVTIWDPVPALCPEGPCRTTRDGRPLYFDGDHFTGYANRVLVTPFANHVLKYP